jgi:hypothetical protein
MKVALSFKCEDYAPEGEPMGPVWTWDEDDPTQRTLEELGWMSLSQAKALAEHCGYSLYED